MQSVEDVGDATVRIEVSGDGHDPATGESFDQWQGSGFIIHSDGTAVTNAHVVAGADAVTAYVGGGSTSVPVEVIGFAPCIDVAVVRLKGSGYRWLRWARQPRPRGRVSAIGHPDGSISVRRTNGRIRAVAPTEPDPQTAITHLIRSDVPIEPGSSGSALVNRRGAVVGVVHAAPLNGHGVFGGGSGATKALAISSTEARPAVTRIRQGHHPADIGVAGRTTLASAEPVAGVRVTDVAPGSPADRSGLRRGDMITRIDGNRIAQITRLDGFCQALQDHTGPEPVHVEVVRPSRGKRYEAQLGETPLRAVGKLDVIDDHLLPAEDRYGKDPYDYVTQRQASGVTRFDLPSQWGGFHTQRLLAYGEVVRSVSAGDYDAVNAAEVHIIGSPAPDAFALGKLYDELRGLDLPTLGYCDSNGRHRLRTDRYDIRYELYVGCLTGHVVLARLRSRDRQSSAAVVMALQGPRDLEALDRIIDSLELDF